MFVKEYFEGNYIVRETEDGTIIKSIISNPGGGVIEIPPNPIEVLKTENEQLKAQISEQNQTLSDFMDYVFNNMSTI
jgi:hypothetical protein